MPKRGYNPTEQHRMNMSKRILPKNHRINISATKKRLFKEGILNQKGKNNNFYGKKHPEERKLRMGLTHKRKWRDKEYRERHISSRLKHWSNPEKKEKHLNAIFKGLELKPNKPEKIVINLIKENNLHFNYVGDGKIWFRGEKYSFNPDFLSKNPKHIIEVFGNYWHNRKDWKERDVERLRTYKKYGYRTLIIWEHELKNTSQVLNKIKEFLIL